MQISGAWRMQPWPQGSSLAARTATACRSTTGGARCHGGAGSTVEIPVSAKCSVATRSRLSMLYVGSYVLRVYTCRTAAKQNHMLRFDLYKMCFTEGGSFFVLHVANPKASPATCYPFTFARPCLRACSALWVWLCTVLQHVTCKKQG